MPIFWRHIHFHHKEPRLAMERYATWVQRSKGVQLNISINTEPFARSAVENVEAIMELFGPHLERWRSLQIDRVALQNIRILLDLLKDGSLPLLERLRVVVLGEGFLQSNDADCEWLGQFAFAAPQLKEVELIGVAMDFNSPLFHNRHALSIGVKGFTKLEPQAIKDIIHQLLRQSPDLKQLFIKKPPTLIRPPYQKPLNPPLINEEPFSYPSLVDLHIDLHGAVHDAIILSTRFPSLRSFRSAWMPRVTLASWHLPLLARNSPFPSLKQINLFGNRHDRKHDRYLVDALCTLTSLEWLGLEQFDMSLVRVANALLALGDCCPQLEALVLLKCTRVDLNQICSLVDMRLRVDGMTGLRTLRIDGGIDTTAPELKVTKAWLEQRVEDVTL
ncbi:hypothetical protein M407DRAFT_5429 [Tulasnella calospora MUT 4182]|uniref:Uncharacterized protein n=1 Tax=Tulasnella calospora MUT 4182 TaxID=1051891 RepID=A0A0C3QSC4_9AGAM|nr:hypothetical protein M407DRAFT_5429 [Tulasnella calospora MUT 4182]